MLLFVPPLELQSSLRNGQRSLHGGTNIREGAEPLHPFNFLGEQQRRFVCALTGYFLESNADRGMKRLFGMPVGIGQTHCAGEQSLLPAQTG